MAEKASIKEKKPFNYNDECNNPAYKSIELQVAFLQLELREMALDKDTTLAAEDQQARMKEFMEGIRKFLLFILDQPSNVCRLYGKKTIQKQGI